MSNQFIAKMCELIDQGIQDKMDAAHNDPVINECLQHIQFCKQKCRIFHGQETALKVMFH